MDSFGPVLFGVLFVIALRNLFQQNKGPNLDEDSALSRQADAQLAQGNPQLAEQTLN